MQMEISDDNDMFQNCSVSINNLDDHIDSTIRSAYDLFQPKTSTFSTRDLIRVHFKTVH